MKSKTIT